MLSFKVSMLQVYTKQILLGLEYLHRCADLGRTWPLHEPTACKCGLTCTHIIPFT